jgi:hypothetical protein
LRLAGALDLVLDDFAKGVDAVGRGGPESAKFPVNFPVSREIGAETGSQLTASLATGGIFKDAPHPNAAKLYITWFLAKEQQSRLGSFSSRVDVPPPEGFQPITSRKIANN